jgi:hypothetical protein
VVCFIPIVKGASHERAMSDDVVREFREHISKDATHSRSRYDVQLILEDFHHRDVLSKLFIEHELYG